MNKDIEEIKGALGRLEKKDRLINMADRAIVESVLEMLREINNKVDALRDETCEGCAVEYELGDRDAEICELKIDLCHGEIADLCDSLEREEKKNKKLRKKVKKLKAENKNLRHSLDVLECCDEML